MHTQRVILFLALVSVSSICLGQQQQDKKLSLDYMQQALDVIEATKALDVARDMMVTAADFDTTNIKANFEAGHMHLQTINKDLAVKYFLRIYHQDPNYRFDLEYWIANSYQYGLQFDNAIDYYTRYRNRLLAKPNYAGKDKIEMKEVDRRIQECNNGKEFVADPKPFAITNMGRDVNSEFEDYAPVLNADETQLVFTTRRRDGNTFENVADDNKPYEDIFISEKTGGSWKQAKNIGPTVNTKYFDSDLTLSPDGNLLFIYKDEGNGDIYVCAKMKDGSWGVPTPLPGIINSSYRESSASITADGKTLYFASERPGGYGGSDIYMCTKDSKGEWSRVKNLGGNINTDRDEDGPFIAFDAKTLYFSSDGRKGMGGFDVFKTTLLNSDKNEWSDPENMGYPINSPDDDIYFSSSKDGQRWYYASVRDDGMGYTDIYVITAIEDNKKEPAVAAKEPVKKEEPKKDSVATESAKIEPPKETPKKEEPKKVVQALKYVVTIVDATTNAPLDAKVRMQSLKEKGAVGAVSKGGGVTEFSIASTSPKEYKISVEKEGYIFQTIKVKIKGASTQPATVKKTIQMNRLAVGSVSILRNIYFDFEKATFRTESYGELNKLEMMMKQNQNLQVEISGHTDFIGSKIYNKKLSQRRADAVKSFLVSKGIDPRRVKAIGYGEEKPLASNDDEREGRAINRRVEFRVLGN